MLFPIIIPPGVYANGTEYEAKGRWRKANLIRWYNGRMRPIGGWQRFTSTALTGVPRALLTWRYNNATARLAVSTESKLYLHDGNTADDITPVDLVPGRANGNYGLGFGADLYSASTYGTPRTMTSLVLDATVWDLDTFGEELIAFSPADGRIFKWTPPNAAVPAAVIDATAPTDNRGVLVTDERFIVALGAAGDPRRIDWCSQEDYTQWTATATNSAGSLQMHSNGLIMAGRRMPSENLIFTDTDVHSLRYAGAPYVYGVERLGSNCGLISRHAHAATQNFCVWMGHSNFFLYDGVVRPLPCDVVEHVYGSLNRVQSSKIVAGVNSEFGEVWWFYPSADAVENDSYVIWNYRENWWAYGSIVRTAWVDREVWDYPLAAKSDGNLFQHEQGWTDSGATRVGSVYAESGPIDIGEGDQLFSVTQALPDTNSGGNSSLSFTFKTKFAPGGSETSYGPYTFSRADGYMDVRFTGRQAKLRLDILQDNLFQFGIMRLDGNTGGKR